MNRDIFLCHAKEDKVGVVRPLVAALKQARVSCWYDEAEICWGDSITQKVNHGLSISRYVIVVLSTSSVGKNWPKRELHAALNIEASSGEVKVLPLLVGSHAEQQAILRQLPLLNDKRCLSWDGNTQEIIASLKGILRVKTARQRSQTLTRKGEAAPARLRGVVKLREDKTASIPLPRLKKQFSQREKDLFIKQTFKYIKSYFRKGLTQLDKTYPEVETDFDSIHTYKFTGTIYVQGEQNNQCVVWLGGFSSSDQISYREGRRIDINNDNSYNDWLRVEDDGFSLYLDPANTWHFGSPREEKLSTNEDAAVYLWKRFSHSLEH